MFQLRWMWKNLYGKRLFFTVAVAISMITSAAAIVNPKLSQLLVDNVIVGVKNANGAIVHHTEMLIPLLVAMLCVQLGISMLRYLMVVFFEKSSQHLVLVIREKLFANLQRQEMRFYDTYRTGDLMTRLTGDLDMVRHFSAWIVYNITDSIVLFTVTLIYFFTISWQLTLSLIAATPLIFVVTYFFSKKIRPVFISLREKLSLLNTAAQENIEGNRVVKAFNREEYETRKFGEKNMDFRNNNLRASYTWLKFFPVLEFLAQSLTVVVVFVGGLMIMQGNMTFGDLTAFTTLTWALSNPMRLLGMILNDLQRFFASANKIIDLYYAQPTIADRNDAVEMPARLKGAVTFDDVTFKFGRELVLDHISFDIKPGETVGIMGPTGSGKTVLINLIARFYDVTSGRVLVDGVDVRLHRLHSLRSSIGMATQDVFLFSDTVDGNIAYCNPDLPEEDVHRFAVAADADGFIREMPEGYETITGERGVGLSGGQKQRLALARALAVRPPILILDDTTSAVDMETEKLIQSNLASLDFPCTKIIVAQRITSVKNADKILILRDHKIAECGTHEELLRAGGYYSEIYRLQQQGVADA